MANEMKCPFCGEPIRQGFVPRVDKNESMEILRCWCNNDSCLFGHVRCSGAVMSQIIEWKAKAKRLKSINISFQTIGNLFDKLVDFSYQGKRIIDAEQEEQDAAKF